MDSNDLTDRIRRRREAVAAVAVGAAYGLAFSVVTTLVVFTVADRCWHHQGTVIERLACAAATILAVTACVVVAGRRARSARRRQ